MKKRYLCEISRRPTPSMRGLAFFRNGEDPQPLKSKWRRCYCKDKHHPVKHTDLHGQSAVRKIVRKRTKHKQSAWRSSLVLHAYGHYTNSTLVIGGLLHTQHVVKCGLPFVTLFQAFLQRSGLGLELIPFLYMVSDNTRTRGGRCIIVRAIRQSK